LYAVCFKVTTRRVLCGVGLAALALGAVLLARGGVCAAGAAASGRLTLRHADQNTARVQFLSGLGWRCSDEPVEVEQVVIPLEFDQVYQNYNAIQRRQGLDLRRYAGCRMTRYSYEVYNYPGEAEEVRANLLVYQSRLAAGDVCSLRLDGFMQGLRPGDESGAPAQSAPGGG